MESFWNCCTICQQSRSKNEVLAPEALASSDVEREQNAAPLDGQEEHQAILRLPETRFLHGEHFGGLSLPLIGGWMGRTLAPAYVAMNVALKRRAETAIAAAR